jgi:hypothetical protein
MFFGNAVDVFCLRMKLIEAAFESYVLQYHNTGGESDSESTNIHYCKALIFGEHAPGGAPVVAEHISRFYIVELLAKQMPLCLIVEHQ